MKKYILILMLAVQAVFCTSCKADANIHPSYHVGYDVTDPAPAPAPVPVTGTTYYFSSTGIAGNTGLSDAQAWPYSKIATYTFLPGDLLLLKKGDTYTGTLAFARSGSSGSPITFDIYGGAINNTVIDGQGSTTAPVLKITGSYVTVMHLVIQHNAFKDGIVFIGGGVHDVTISNCYINNGIRGINAVGCGSGGIADLRVIYDYFTNIQDNTTHSNGGGSHVQFNNCNGSGQEIAYNYCYTPVTVGVGSPATDGVGDILSVYQCNGTSTSLIIVHDNYVRGGSSHSNGYCGLVLGDVGGSYQYGYNNIFINAGKEGAQVQGGTNINLSNNKIYSAVFPYSNVGIAFGNYSSAACNNITISNNHITFYKSSGSIFNKWIDAAVANANSTATGASGGPALATPAGWSTNTADNSVDAAAFDALLPNPLWTGSPWNTATTGNLTLRGRILHIH